MRHKRKQFSYSKRIQIACRQNYKCPGEICQSKVDLPSTWELDHKKPLCSGGSNEESNLWVLCPNCHAQKTQHEKFVQFSSRKKTLRGLEFIIDSIQKKNIQLQQYFRALRNQMKSQTDTAATHVPLYFDKSTKRFIVSYFDKEQDVMKRKSFSIGRYGNYECAKSEAIEWYKSRSCWIH